MRNIDCRNVRSEIEAAAPGDVLSADVNDHLVNCVACETLSREQAKLLAIVSSLGTIEAPGDFDFRLRARLAGEKRRSAQPFALGSLSFGLPAVAVAMILLMIGSAAVFVSFKTSSDNQLSAGTAKTVPNSGANQQGTDRSINVRESAAPESAPGLSTKDVNVVDASLGSGEVRAPKQPGFRKQVATLRDANRVRTKDFSSTPAPVLKRFDQLAETYPTSAFPIDASYQSLKVSVDDGRGSSRTISLPTVSFGSQRALSQNLSPLISSARGAW